MRAAFLHPPPPREGEEKRRPPDLKGRLHSPHQASVCTITGPANAVAGPRFTVNLIPHTLDATTLGTLRAGDAVNIEVDMIARYVERLRACE